MSDIVERLREGGGADWQTAEEAAAEIERLKKERDWQYDQNCEQITRLAALEADNERLRAALEEVRALVFNANYSTTRYPKARAALEEKT